MHLKIVTVGPRGTGKTIISNFIAGQSDVLNLTEGYVPTAGVRILEFSYPDVNEIELWDMSGDSVYEGCWKSIIQDADGIILVYNPDAPAQDQQIADWFEFFVRRNGMKDEQCVVFAHRNLDGKGDKFRPPTLFSRVNAALTTNQSTSEVRSMFEILVKDLQSIKRRK